jgi:hypothetical protein
VHVAVEDGALVISQWYGFRSRIPLPSITSVEPIAETTWWRGIGAHGWSGRWTVNTRRRPAVRITIDPPARGRVLGFPVRVHTLDIAPVDIDALRREMGAGV